MITLTKRLEIGLIDKSEGNLDVLKEMLNHQGVIFKEINQLDNKNIKFPCVILIGDNKNDYKRAKNYCLTAKNVILMHKIIQLDLVFSAFSGVLDSLYLEDKLMIPQITKLELELINKIRKCYYRLGLPFIRKWFWPNFAQACCVITHDIDTLNNPPPSQKKLDWLKYAITKLFIKKAYKSNIEEILREEKRRGLKSSFYFLPDYGKYHKDFLNYINLIDDDFEIGLHAPLHTHYDPSLLREHRNSLSRITNKQVVGIRQHGLYFSVPHTWRYYDDVGFDYDATFSYNNKFGFRAGICYPYHPFDALNHNRFKVLEIPTSFMDWTGLYKNMSYNDLFKKLSNLEKTVEMNNGCLVLIFHNMYIDKNIYPELTRLFINTLDYVSEKKYWVTTAAECSQWWRKRENAKIDIKLKNGVIYGNTSDPLPISIEQFKKKIIYKNLENAFQIKLNKGV